MLPSEGVSIHWHGIEQKGTPYMDGASFVTQYPIDPYTFKLNKSGTFWYRALIVRDRDHPIHLQNVSSDFILQVQEWNHDYDADQEILVCRYILYLS